MLADYAPPLDRLIVALKFGSDLPAAQALGRLLAERARQQGCALPGLLVPVPLAPRRLAQDVTGFIQEVRETELYKIPGVSETIDWISKIGRAHV